MKELLFFLTLKTAIFSNIIIVNALRTFVFFFYKFFIGFFFHLFCAFARRLYTCNTNRTKKTLPVIQWNWLRLNKTHIPFAFNCWRNVIIEPRVRRLFDCIELTFKPEAIYWGFRGWMKTSDNNFWNFNVQSSKESYQPFMKYICA